MAQWVKGLQFNPYNLSGEPQNRCKIQAQQLMLAILGFCVTGWRRGGRDRREQEEACGRQLGVCSGESPEVLTQTRCVCWGGWVLTWKVVLWPLHTCRGTCVSTCMNIHITNTAYTHVTYTHIMCTHGTHIIHMFQTHNINITYTSNEYTSRILHTCNTHTLYTQSLSKFR